MLAACIAKIHACIILIQVVRWVTGGSWLFRLAQALLQRPSPVSTPVLREASSVTDRCPPMQESLLRPVHFVCMDFFMENMYEEDTTVRKKLQPSFQVSPKIFGAPQTGFRSARGQSKREQQANGCAALSHPARFEDCPAGPEFPKRAVWQTLLYAVWMTLAILTPYIYAERISS